MPPLNVQARSLAHDFARSVAVRGGGVRPVLVFVLGSAAVIAAVRSVWGFFYGPSTIAESRGERAVDWAVGGAREGFFVGLVLVGAAELLSRV